MSTDSSGSERDGTQGPDDDPPVEPDAVTQAGVLGNLPKSRPTVRSPRRAEKEPAPPADQAPRGARTSPKSDSQASSPEPDETKTPTRSGTEEIEALARGGIAIAGEAASLGLRIAGRAAAAVRDAVERR